MHNVASSAVPARRISVLAFDGCMGMEVFALCDMLMLANRVVLALRGPGAPALFDVRVVSLRGGEVRVAGGIAIGSRKARGATDLLVVPGMDIGDRNGCTQPHTALAPEVAWIARVFARGTPVASLCVGAFLLAEAGLLDGRRATTAWLVAPDLARRFARVRVEPDAMLIEDGGVTTTGALTAAFDLALHLIGQTARPDEARMVAKIALLNERASQAPYVDTAMLAPPSRFSDQVHHWLAARLAQPYALAPLAAAFNVSGRTLLRRLHAETGQSPLAFLQAERINQAKRLLESGKASLAQVTELVGYFDVATFSALFKRLAGETPASYRKRFRQTGAVSR